MDAKPQDVETDTRSVKRRISKAWDRCGTLPAREAVKVVPRDWHWFRDVTEALVSERDAQAAEITALRAERDALAARLAVPGEGEMDGIAATLRARDLLHEAAALTALRARVAGLEGALTTLQAGDYPRPIGERWRADGKPSTHDRCTHGAMMNEPCETCADAFISAALSPSAAQEAPK